MSSRKARSGRRKDADMSVTLHSKYVHVTDGEVRRRQYEDGSLALQVESVDEDGFPEVTTLSVNLSAYTVAPPEGHIWVKDYAESEGLPDAIVAAGLGEVVRDEFFGPFNSRFVLVKLSESVLS
jgi:hypothetical protein